MLSTFKFISRILIVFCLTFNFTNVLASTNDFNEWLLSFKERALNEGVSENTFDLVFENVKFYIISCKNLCNIIY